jgi:hypothetical protein
MQPMALRIECAAADAWALYRQENQLKPEGRAEEDAGEAEGALNAILARSAFPFLEGHPRIVRRSLWRLWSRRILLSVVCE